MQRWVVVTQDSVFGCQNTSSDQKGSTKESLQD